MKIRNFFLAALAVLTLGAGPAFAQTSVIIRKPDNSGAQVDIGAQVSPFKPTGNATLAVTTSSARVALPSTGATDTTVVVRNTGATDAAINLGNSSVTAATTNFLLPAGSTVVLSAVGSTNIAAITASSTTSLAISTGSGVPSFQAAAGAGGGGGGAVTNAGTFLVQNNASEVAGENHIGEVGGHTVIVGATFTTTATTTALADGQLLANSGTAGSVTPLDFSGVCRVNQGTGMIRRARVKIPDTGLAAKSLFLKLYRDSPTVTNGDHGAWLSTESNYLGQISVTLDQHFSDPYEKGVGAPTVGGEINFDCASASTHLYGLIVANGASTTLQGTKVLTAVLEVLDN